MADSRVPLKKDTQLLAAFSICRSCLIAHKLTEAPTVPFPNDQLCAVKGCENPSAYLTTSTPFGYSQ